MKDMIIDFHVRLWNGSVSIHDRENLDYALYAKGQSGERMEGFQCNYEDGSAEYKALLDACRRIADGYLAMGKVLESKKD